MTNRYEVVVESRDVRDGVAWLRMRTGRGRLAAAPWEGLRPRAAATVAVSPREVLLCSEHPGRVSARNVLPGRVRSVRVAPGGAYVTLDVGFPLVALVTRRTVREMSLAPGTPLFAVVKAVSVAPEFGASLRFRAAAVGPRGTIGPGKIDFLRALDRAGSLTSAARLLGTTYRTAWTWSRSVNRAWGGALVALVRGGKGGGGVVLTPEGRLLLERASAWETRGSGRAD